MNAPTLAPLAAETPGKLKTVSTATLTMQLLKRGLRRIYVGGAMPLSPGYGRIVGEAFTMRFIPHREDISSPAQLTRPGSSHAALDAVPAGAVVVVDSRGDRYCGTIGDILAMRLVKRGAGGFVSDGCVRDAEGIRRTGLPVFCAGAAAPPSSGGLFFAGWGDAIGCGGIAVIPGDVAVCDDDGVVVIPRGLADEVARDGVEQERLERFILRAVRRGHPLAGFYPPTPATLAEYRDWIAAGEPED